MTSRGVVVLTLGLNVALCAAHFLVWHLTGSELVLAQGADSLMDLAVGVVLLVSVRVAAQPRDENHPFGHQRAEPIGALVTSVLAFVLAIEVARSAIESLLRHAAPAADGSVVGVLGAKLGLKLALLLMVLRRRRGRGSQAVDATHLDTFNDVLTTSSSLFGVWLVRSGHPSIDGWFALPIAAYMARNGFNLARESLRYLMGESPGAPVLARLRGAASAIDGVQEITGLRAHFVGSVLHVETVILIAAGSTAKRGHDIALDVQRTLERDPLVGEVFVHIDTGEGKDGT